MWKWKSLPQVLQHSTDCDGIGKLRLQLAAEKKGKRMKAKFYSSCLGPPQRILRGGAFAALLLFQAVLVMAQASLLDTSFNPASGTNELITAMARQPDG